MNAPLNRPERGAALVVGMIMLVLITLMLITAFNLGTSNLKAVGNMQVREQALAAANAAIQERVSSSFNTAPATSTTAVDLNNDGVTDFNVTVTPVCIGATKVFSAPPSSVSLGPSMSASPIWNTTWDVRASSVDPATGASVAVRTGVRVQLSDAEKDIACP